MKSLQSHGPWRRHLVLLLAVALLSTTAWGGYRVWPRVIAIAHEPRTPIFVSLDGLTMVLAPTEGIVAEVAQFEDELTAYLHFQRLQRIAGRRPAEVLLTARETGQGPTYTLALSLGNNLLSAVSYCSELKAERFIPGFDIRYAPGIELANRRQQTRVFVAAYNLPVQRKLEKLTLEEVKSPLVRYLMFRSKTDPRVRRGMEPPPPVLQTEEARRLAADILAVARFYDLPLDLFLGIGAMENNFMDVEGDLKHAVWKRRSEPGDLVIARRNGRVLVRNFSVGRWQITRETLRHAHRLYLRDRRDYEQLPERLRPPKQLNLNMLDLGTLTTYAGLLFRDLLDRFGGDMDKAVGAYNGGPGNPNLSYATGVQAAAEYARSILEQSAALNGAAVVETQFLAPARQ